MDKATLYKLITASTSAEGSTLTLAQNTRLFDEGRSSEGKTIAEQLMNLDLKSAYESAVRDAESHQVWSGYRIKLLACKALRGRGFDAGKVSDEASLQEICHEANEARMHWRSLGEQGLRKAAADLCEKTREAVLWHSGNAMMGRLLQNMLEIEFGLEPSCLPLKQSLADTAPAAPSVKNSERILQILAAHPHRTTADLAAELGITDKGVEKHLSNLKKKGLLRRVGPDKGGYWLVPEF